VNGTTEAPLLVSAIPGGGHEMAKGKPMVKHAAAGEDFALVVTENGLLYSWGSGAFGQVRARSLSAPRSQAAATIARPHPHECARVHARASAVGPRGSGRSCRAGAGGQVGGESPQKREPLRRLPALEPCVLCLCTRVRVV
jgi:hypothetical protein